MILGFPYVVFAAISAALIAGIVSFLGLVLGKEQKISEFRQAWIDGLRNEVSSLISNANAIALYPTDPKTISHFVAVNDAEAHIRLRLNPAEPTTIAIIRVIERIAKVVAPGSVIKDFAILNEIEKHLINEVNVVLKKEWKRVKRGEPVYWVAKYTVLAVVVTIIGLGIIEVGNPNLLSTASTILIPKNSGIIATKIMF